MLQTLWDFKQQTSWSRKDIKPATVTLCEQSTRFSKSGSLFVHDKHVNKNVIFFIYWSYLLVTTKTKKQKPHSTDDCQKASHHFLYTLIYFMNKVSQRDCTSSAIIKKRKKQNKYISVRASCDDCVCGELLCAVLGRIEKVDTDIKERTLPCNLAVVHHHILFKHRS